MGTYPTFELAPDKERTLGDVVDIVQRWRPLLHEGVPFRAIVGVRSEADFHAWFDLKRSLAGPVVLGFTGGRHAPLDWRGLDVLLDAARWDEARELSAGTVRDDYFSFSRRPPRSELVAAAWGDAPAWLAEEARRLPDGRWHWKGEPRDAVATLAAWRAQAQTDVRHARLLLEGRDLDEAVQAAGRLPAPLFERLHRWSTFAWTGADAGGAYAAWNGRGDPASLGHEGGGIRIGAAYARPAAKARILSEVLARADDLASVQLESHLSTGDTVRYGVKGGAPFLRFTVLQKREYDEYLAFGDKLGEMGGCALAITQWG